MKKLSKELQSYAKDYGIDYSCKYLFKTKKKTEIVRPVIDSESYQGALGHGFVHYLDSKNKINFCGVCYFQENSKKL